MNSAVAQLCDDARMSHILAVAGQDPQRGVKEVDEALEDFPEDQRLHFFKGSLLIGLKRHIAAHGALSRAVEIAPDFALARFQLGFFELTSGEADAARMTFAPLHDLPSDHWLRIFAEGLEFLIADRFEECIERLCAGQKVNTENEPLNRDMQLIIEKCEQVIGAKPDVAASEEISTTSLLLRSSRAPRRPQ